MEKQGADKLSIWVGVEAGFAAREYKKPRIVQGFWICVFYPAFQHRLKAHTHAPRMKKANSIRMYSTVKKATIFVQYKTPKTQYVGTAAVQKPVD